MSNSNKNLVEELFAEGKIEIQDETPASCILGCTTSSYDLDDMEEYGAITGKEVTLDELLKSDSSQPQELPQSHSQNLSKE